MNILIVEDHEPTRNGLASLLSRQRNFTVVNAVESAEQALQEMAGVRVDIVILDLGLSGLSGKDAICAVKSQAPETEILVFTVMEDDEQVFAAIKAGASGYILKDARPNEIIAAIEELSAGGAPMSLSIARKVLKEFQGIRRQEELNGLVSALSPREADILLLLYKGDSYKEIADKLSLSTHTIHGYIKNVYAKLHVNSRAQAIYEAIRKNIISV